MQAAQRRSSRLAGAAIAGDGGGNMGEGGGRGGGGASDVGVSSDSARGGGEGGGSGEGTAEAKKPLTEAQIRRIVSKGFSFMSSSNNHSPLSLYV